jgi:hypothetical protein
MISVLELRIKHGEIALSTSKEAKKRKSEMIILYSVRSIPVDRHWTYLHRLPMIVRIGLHLRHPGPSVLLGN